MKIYNVAIIGGGPGGIASAVEAVMLGIGDVVLIEKSDNHSATIRKFYKDNKRVDKDYRGHKVDLHGNIYFVDGTKESTLDLFDEILKTHKIEECFKTEVESVKKEGDLFRIFTTDGREIWTRFVVISIGKMGQPNKPTYEIPASIKHKVHFNINECQGGERILVVGGGNSAVEYAYFLAEQNDTTLNYRKSEFTRVNEQNIALLHEAVNKDGLKLKLGVDIEKLQDSQNNSVEVHFCSGDVELFDRVVYAIGGIAPTDFLRKCLIDLDEHGVPITTSSHESSVEGIYIAGDILLKSGGSIAAALNHGFSIVQEIKKRLS